MEDDAISMELERLRSAGSEQKTTETIQMSDFCKFVQVIL